MSNLSWINFDKAKQKREEGDFEIAEILSAQRPTLSYEPQEWELDYVDERIEFYHSLGAIGQVRQKSREATISLLLSMESILRRHGHIAFADKKDYWDGRCISSRVPRRLLRALVSAEYLLPRQRQVGKRPKVFDASQAFLEALPACPEGEAEGLLISDKPWQPVEIKEVEKIEDLEGFGDRSHRPEIEQAEQEVLALSEWMEANRHRIEGVDDLRFHRVFRHSLNWGGRLYGQFTSMDRNLHRPLIRIDGERTEEADLNGSYLSFFLLMAGREDLPQDPYQHGSLAQFERSFVKALVVRLFGKGEWWSLRYPQYIYDNKAFLGYQDKLPSYRTFREAMCATYPELHGFEEFKPTLRIEAVESRALLDTLHWLQDQGEVGLPIHDGIRVRQSITSMTQERFKEARSRAARRFRESNW